MGVQRAVHDTNRPVRRALPTGTVTATPPSSPRADVCREEWQNHAGPLQ